MVKHTQAILRRQPTNCLSVIDHFVGLVLKGLIISEHLVFVMKIVVTDFVDLIILFKLRVIFFLMFCFILVYFLT